MKSFEISLRDAIRAYDILRDCPAIWKNITQTNSTTYFVENEMVIEVQILLDNQGVEYELN